MSGKIAQICFEKLDRIQDKAVILSEIPSMDLFKGISLHLLEDFIILNDGAEISTEQLWTDLVTPGRFKALNNLPPWFGSFATISQFIFKIDETFREELNAGGQIIKFFRRIFEEEILKQKFFFRGSSAKFWNQTSLFYEIIPSLLPETFVPEVGAFCKLGWIVGSRRTSFYSRRSYSRKRRISPSAP